MIRYRLDELAERLGAELIGSPERVVSAVRPLDEAGPNDLSFLHNARYVAQACASGAGAILLGNPALVPERDVLVCDEPYLAFARALALFNPEERAIAGAHPSAVVAEDAVLGADVSVGAQAVIGPAARIGARTEIGAGSVVGRSAVVGEDCRVHPRVVIEDGCCVGDRCILHSGVVLGSDGFGFATVAGIHHKVPQVGIVVIEDDVELGANVCVDRATMGETRIGRGTKVDNMAQIAHNVRVGEDCLLVAQVGLAGSVTLGNHVVMAGQSGVAGHLTVGDRAMIAGKATVMKDVPEGAVIAGIPGRPQREWMAATAALYRLTSLRDRVQELEKKMAELETTRRE